MEHVYAALLLNESGTEPNERNLTAVLEAAGCAGDESRTKALVAALEDVEVDGVGPAVGEPDDRVEDPRPATDGREEPTDAAPTTEG